MMRTSTNAWAMLIPRMVPGMPLLSCTRCIPYPLELFCSLGATMHMLMLSVQVGQTIASINLILVSEVAVVERRGYLTLSVEAGGVGRNYFRRTTSIR